VNARAAGLAPVLAPVLALLASGASPALAQASGGRFVKLVAQFNPGCQQARTTVESASPTASFVFNSSCGGKHVAAVAVTFPQELPAWSTVDNRLASPSRGGISGSWSYTAPAGSVAYSVEGSAGTSLLVDTSCRTPLPYRTIPGGGSVSYPLSATCDFTKVAGGGQDVSLFNVVSFGIQNPYVLEGGLTVSFEARYTAISSTGADLEIAVVPVGALRDAPRWEVVVRNRGPEASSAATVSAERFRATREDGPFLGPDGQPCAEPCTVPVGALAPGASRTFVFQLPWKETIGKSRVDLDAWVSGTSPPDPNDDNDFAQGAALRRDCDELDCTWTFVLCTKSYR